MIIEVMQPDIQSRYESHKTSGVLTFLELQIHYARESYPNSDPYSVHIWMKLNNKFDQKYRHCLCLHGLFPQPC